MKKGNKDAIGNINKPRLSLIPKKALWELGRALTIGEVIKGSHNFRNGIPISYLLDGALRHINEFNDGFDRDEDTQALHLGNAMANLAMAIEMYYIRPDLDDRYEKGLKNVHSKKTKTRRPVSNKRKRKSKRS